MVPGTNIADSNGLLAHRITIRDLAAAVHPHPTLCVPFSGCKRSQFSRVSPGPLKPPLPARHAYRFALLAGEVSQCAPQSWLGSGQKESAGEEALRG